MPSYEPYSYQRLLGYRRELGLQFRRFLHFGNAAFDRIDEIRTQLGGRNYAIESAYLERPLHAVYTVKLGGHFAQLLGVHDLEEFVPLGAQSAFVRALSLRHRLAQFLEARIFFGPRFHLTGEDHSCRRSAADDRGVSSLQGRHFEIFVEPARENYVRPAVIARDHAKDHRASKVDHRPPNLGAVFKLQPAHRLG